MTKLDRLHELQNRLEAFQIYHPPEVEVVSAVRDQAELEHLFEPVLIRFRELYEPAQEDFRRTLSAFVRLYLSLEQTLSARDPELEKLSTFGRLLLARLPDPPERERLEIAEGGGLESYGSMSQAKEIDLLRRIYRELPHEVADRYRMLMEKRRAETLTEAEHAELIRLTDQSEQLQAERIKSLAELAHLRRIPLTKLVEDLDFRPRSNA